MLIIGYLAGDLESVEIPDANDSMLMKELIGKIHKVQYFDAQDAGTVFRFLTALFAIIPGKRLLTGTARMLQRPVGPLVRALSQAGAEIEYLKKEGFPPLVINGKDLSGGDVEIDGSLSSQFISALMMIAPYMNKGLNLKLKGRTVSWPYVEMTAKLMDQCGVKTEMGSSDIFIPSGGYNLIPNVYEADWSAASYWFQLVSVQEGATVTLTGLKKNSVQGDSILEVLYKNLGVDSFWQDNNLIIKHNPNSVNRLELDLSDTPDLAPAIAVTCAAKRTEAILTGLSALTIKESNRLESIAQNLKSLGFNCEIQNKQALVIGGHESGAINNHIITYNDHRIAMAMSLLSLTCGSLIVDDMTVINKSYPQFWSHLKSAGFIIEYTS